MTDAAARQTKAVFQPKHILFPTDFSPYAFYAMNYALALARSYGATLHIGHVLDTTINGLTGSTGVWLPQDEIDRVLTSMEEHADSRLDTLVQQAADEGVAAVKHMRRGHPAHDIGKMAEDLDCDLVVISTHGRSGLEHLVMGSTAERVVREAPIPVLSVKHPEHEFVDGATHKIHLKRVLFPMDFSPYCEEALDYAVSLCNNFNATLVLLHVNELSVMLPEYLPEMALSSAIDMTANAQESLKEIAEGIEGIEVEHYVKPGLPHREIGAAVEEYNIDLIVIPTHGRSGFLHVLFGSVAEKVVRLAKCPVLSVRPEAFRGQRAAGDEEE
jgi:nucleotide-binding universal stress UspA family protein